MPRITIHVHFAGGGETFRWSEKGILFACNIKMNWLARESCMLGNIIIELFSNRLYIFVCNWPLAIWRLQALCSYIRANYKFNQHWNLALCAPLACVDMLAKYDKEKHKVAVCSNKYWLLIVHPTCKNDCIIDCKWESYIIGMLAT